MKIAVGKNMFTPMPVTLVGANVGGEGKLHDCSLDNQGQHSPPPMLAMAVNRARYTHTGIRQTGTFSVCLPGLLPARHLSFRHLRGHFVRCRQLQRVRCDYIIDAQNHRRHFTR